LHYHAAAEAMPYITPMDPKHPLSSSLTEKLLEAIQTNSQADAIERALRDVNDEEASHAKRTAARIFLATTEGYEEYQ
jgi:hypothetical protein